MGKHEDTLLDPLESFLQEAICLFPVLAPYLIYSPFAACVYSDSWATGLAKDKQWCKSYLHAPLLLAGHTHTPFRLILDT